MTTGATAGLLLAAGAGRRYGGPKALVPGWLAARAAALVDGGCAPVVVVLGAQAARARELVPSGVEVVVAAGWETGMGASLRAGLEHLAGSAAAAVVVVLVDLPGLTAEAVRRVRARGEGEPEALVQATYDGNPGHPVLLGRTHWAPVADLARGDRGARAYLATRTVARVECGDVADGRDVDTPAPQARTDQP